ncbi:CPBP family intramembrane glutamic endopeptidase [Actinophytocola glycyrrhizae]|uniref:CPBP family intramembrane glutamic endopeptidase n=1 Tax=Actinophytocola glycyrrhizae TaxID=2044873 RepID=A0ABV9RTX5_9PSEU
MARPWQSAPPEDWASAGSRAGTGRGAGWRMLSVFLVAQVALLATAFFVLVPFAVNDSAFLRDGRLGTWPLIALLVVPSVTAALVAVAGTAWFGPGTRPARVRRELALRWSRRDAGRGLAIGAGGLLLTIPAAVVWASWIGSEQATSAVGAAFGDRRLGPLAAGLMFLVVWLVAPLAEEVLFRGVLWRAFEHWRWNRWLVFAVTSAVFSVAHMELLRTPLLLVLSIPIGLARLVTGNLLTCVVAHQVNNFLPALALLLAATGALPS